MRKNTIKVAKPLKKEARSRLWIQNWRISRRRILWHAWTKKESALYQEAFKTETGLFRKGKEYNIEGSTQTKKITEAAKLRKSEKHVRIGDIKYAEKSVPGKIHIQYCCKCTQTDQDPLIRLHVKCCPRDEYFPACDMCKNVFSNPAYVLEDKLFA